MGGCRFDSVSDLPEKYREKINAEIKRQNVNRAAHAAVELVQSAREAKEKLAKKKERKFHNRPTERIMPNGDVRTFDSAREASRYDELMLLLRAGEIRDLKIQPQFTLKESYITANGDRSYAVTYRADFFYEARAKDGAWRFVVEDVKSERTRKNKDYRIKVKLMQEVRGITVQEVF